MAFTEGREFLTSQIILSFNAFREKWYIYSNENTVAGPIMFFTAWFFYSIGFTSYSRSQMKQTHTCVHCTVKPVLSGHSKIDETKILNDKW